MGRGDDNVVGGTDVVVLVWENSGAWKVDCLRGLMVNLVVACSLKV